MSEIINLRRARKVKTRRDEAERAAVNRADFGRTRAERAHASAEAALMTRKLDGHSLEGSCVKNPPSPESAVDHAPVCD